jgi:hypothetical protein
MSHSREGGKLYLIRDVRKEDENTLIGELIVLQLSDDFCLFQDAGLWCAVPPGFQDFDEDPVGWGHTQREAVQNLVASAEFRTTAAREGWNENPAAVDFTVLDKSAERPYQPDSPEAEQ